MHAASQEPRTITRDPAALELRRARTPLEVANTLAGEYGHALEPVNYVRGVAISARLRLHALDHRYPNPAADITGLVDPLLTDETFNNLANSDGSTHAGLVWADELTELTGDTRYTDFLIRIADLYLTIRPGDGLPQPVDPDSRVEDIFFAGAVLGRAFAVTEDLRYANAMASVLGKVRPQRETVLYHHCQASPYYWGRGNAFAALGFAEALSYLPEDHPATDAIAEKHVAHLTALLPHQHESGAWRQVIDRPDSYLELTVTAMLGYSIARTLRLGYTPEDTDETFEQAADLAWSAVSERVDDHGNVYDSCTGTGPLPTLDDYLNRPTENGHDDRGGSMALWFATEYEQMLRAYGE